MPGAPPKSTMSLRELVACEDLLEGHQEYAIDLLSSLEDIRECHPTDTCSKICQGRSCTLCDIGSATGLAGAANKALKSYLDAGNHLNIARASLGRRVALPGRVHRVETLFKSELAKTIFLCVATVGDDLRSQHVAWQARLRSDIETASLSGGSSKDISKAKGVLSTYSGPKVVDPESQSRRTTVPTRSVQGTSSTRDSMFLVFRRCLSSDCPCGANATGVWESQHTANVPGRPSDPKKMRVSKERTMSGATTRGTSILSDSLVNPRTDAETLSDTPGEQNASNPTSDTTALTPNTIEPTSSVSMIVDPRVYRFREQIARSDEARRVLMDWCRAWTTDLLCPLEATLGTGTEPEATSSAQASTVGTDCTLTLAPDVEPVDSDRSLSIIATSSSREVTTQGRSGDDDETIAYEMTIWFSSKQEELKEKWLMARQRCRKRGPHYHNVDFMSSIVYIAKLRCIAETLYHQNNLSIRNPYLATVNMSATIETLRAALDDTEKHHQSSKALLAEIAKEGEQVQTLIEETTVPRENALQYQTLLWT
ncbi:hypothetical protein JVU11DRAFT_11729 [Chiua virens]|nr:hypothetical protein JVU11DRAFT_11729 [Chiua virens]